MGVSTPLTWRQKKIIALLAASTRNSTDVNLQEPTGMNFTTRNGLDLLRNRWCIMGNQPLDCGSLVQVILLW